MEVEGEEESVDEVGDVIKEILAYGMQHGGNVNNHEFQERLANAIRKDDAKPASKKKSAFSLRKQEKKQKAQRALSKAIDGSSGEHREDSSEDTCPIEVGTSDAFAPTAVSSFRHLKNQAPDDTPLYVKEEGEVLISDEGETSEDRELLASIERMSLSAEEKLIQEGLTEIRAQLDSGNIPTYRFIDHGWRSAFIALNTTEVLGEEELNNFIDEYAKARA